MKTKEDTFKNELEIFRSEVESVIHSFYAFTTLNRMLNENKALLKIVNQTPRFWITTISALQTSFFIALGRIFGQGHNHNIDKILSISQQHIEIFSKEAYRARLSAGGTLTEEQLQDIIKDSYSPTVDDFRRLKKYVNQYRKVYFKKYHDIRNKVHAHKELSTREDIQALYEQTSFKELEKMLIFLNKIHSVLWQSFNNGIKPMLRPMRYSTGSMIKEGTPLGQSRHAQERIVEDTKKFMESLLSLAK